MPEHLSCRPLLVPRTPQFGTKSSVGATGIRLTDSPPGSPGSSLERIAHITRTTQGAMELATYTFSRLYEPV